MTALTPDPEALETSELDVLELDDDRAVTPDDAAPDAETPDVGEPDERPSHLRVAPTIAHSVLRRRRRTQLVVFAVAAISAASMFMLVTFHVFAAQSAFKLDKLDKELVREQRDYGLLRDRVATASSPEAVANAAAGLGLIRDPGVTLLRPAAPAAFGSSIGLPVPPPPPYTAIGAGT